MLTREILETLQNSTDGVVIATGIVQNNEGGVYMTDFRKNDDLRWVAKVGSGYADWAIYIHWAEHSLEWVLQNGDKVTTQAYIKKLVPCDDEALKLYRR